MTTNVEWKPAAQLPELAGHCRGQESQCGEGADPVSLATGQLSYSHRDLLLTNNSDLPLEFARAYSSGSGADAGLGPGLVADGPCERSPNWHPAKSWSSARTAARTSSRKRNPATKPPSGVTDTLAKVEGTFQLTTLENIVYRFDSSGRITWITDDHGLKTTYTYNANGRLPRSPTPPARRSPSPTTPRPHHAGQRLDGPRSQIRLLGGWTIWKRSPMPSAAITKYAYDPQHRITSITDPRGNVILKNTYNSQGRIVEQRDGLENLWKLEYRAGETIVTEPRAAKSNMASTARIASSPKPISSATRRRRATTRRQRR